MSHPLLTEGQKDLRKRMVNFIKSGLLIPQDSDLVFVCGGNKDHELRVLFKKYYDANKVDFVYFQPEFAMKNLFSSDLKEQIDLVDFESLIGDLSLAIVIFPEAAGSFAETGYFSAIESLSSKIILVLDNNYQGNDSFIMLGPAKKIAENSYFTPNLQIDYRNPDFSHVVKRISRKKRLYKKELSIGKFSEISNFDLYCLIQYIVSVLKVANIGNILFLMRSIFGAHIEKKRVQKISSILFGAGYFVGIGEVGEFVPSDSFPIIANVKTGMKNERNALFEELTELYLNSGDDFVRKMGAK